MKNIFLVIQVAFIASLISCKTNKNIHESVKFNYSNFENTVKLKGDTIKLLDFGNPRRIEFYKQYIFFRESKDNYLMSVYDIKNQKKIFSFLLKGKGPNELLSATNISVNQGTKILTVLDIITQKINIYNVDSLLKFNSLPLEVVQLDYNQYKRKLLSTHDTSFVSTGLSKRISFFNTKGMLIDTIGDYSIFDCKDEDIWLTQKFECELTYNNNSNNIAVFNRFTDIIELYKNRKLYKVVQGPDCVNEYSEIVSVRGGKSVGHSRTKSRYAYMHLCSNENKIFALYSGKFWGEPGFHNSTILSFNWEGKPVAHYELDIPISTFTVDWANGIIYGLNIEKEPMLIIYRF